MSLNRFAAKGLLVALPALLIGCGSVRYQPAGTASVAADGRLCSPGAENISAAGPTAIALSGGGFRAMLFHVGFLWRLNELRILEEADMISSVSGGSILAGILAANWQKLDFDPSRRKASFQTIIAQRAINLSASSIDAKAIVLGMLPWLSASQQLERFFAAQDFGGTKLAKLPEHPRFIFNATNLQTGHVWRFTRNCVGDDAVGYTTPGDLTLATAITASSAYPPFLSPLTIDLRDREWTKEKWPTKEDKPEKVELYEDLGTKIDRDTNLQQQYRHEIQLTDGGIADNLGATSILDSAKELFVSNGGAGLNVSKPVESGLIDEVTRLIDIIYSQPSELRSRIMIELFTTGKKLAKATGENIWDETPYVDGIVISIRGPVYRHKERSHEHNVLNLCFEPHIEEAKQLAELPTRLDSIDPLTAQRLINWGYFVTDNAMPFLARIFRAAGQPPGLYELATQLPYHAVGFGSGSAQCLAHGGPEVAGRPDAAVRRARPRIWGRAQLFRAFCPEALPQRTLRASKRRGREALAGQKETR